MYPENSIKQVSSFLEIRKSSIWETKITKESWIPKMLLRHCVGHGINSVDVMCK